MTTRERPKRFTKWISLATLGLALAVYLLVGTRDLTLPGLYSDEALDAVPAMEVTLGMPSSAMANLRLSSLNLPLMVMPYIGGC